MGVLYQLGFIFGVRFIVFCGIIQMVISKNKKKEVNIQRQNRNGEVNYSLDYGIYVGRY